MIIQQIKTEKYMNKSKSLIIFICLGLGALSASGAKVYQQRTS